ncbi:hypothetical protein SSX86_021985 [Deinandra increscens subsp. villosa]|uniref:LRAT domain-containing protein n=1 Tax=Deinandra increscens subsp. villosa TaxID=3103831 RepID=A0AAP0CMC4_9ASTR
MVVHFTAPETANSGSGWNLSSSTPSFLSSIDCGLSQPEIGQDCDSGECLSAHFCGFKQSNSGVMVSCLNCFIGTGSPYLYQYGVSNLTYVTKLRGGTCTITASDPPEDVIGRAIYLLHNGFGEYNMVKNNCEDFALYCKTGLLISGKPTTGGSGQVNFVYNLPWKSIVSSAVMACKSTVAGAAVFTVAVPVRTVLKRYKADIGVRKDAVKVKVEDVGLFRGV